MTDRTGSGAGPDSGKGPSSGEGPVPGRCNAVLDGWESGSVGWTANGSCPGSPALRADGGDPSGGLFAAIPDPALRFELEDGSPVVVDVNAAYRERFEVDAGASGPLEGRLGSDLELPELGDGLAKIDDIAELVECAVAGSRARAVVRADAGDGEHDYLARVVPRSESDEAVRAGEADGDGVVDGDGEAAGASEDDGDGKAAGASEDGTASEVGGYVVLTDVTDQLDLTRELVDQRDRLDEFASFVSHDLRNPLEVAKIQLEAAQNRGDVVHFEKVEEAHARMERIVEDVLTLARQGQVIDEVDEVSLSTVAADAWDSIAAPGAALTIEEDVVLQADEGRLQELLENLFRNAVEHGSTSPDSQARQDAVEQRSTGSRTEAGDAVEDSSTSPRSEAREDAVEHVDPAVTVTVGRAEEGFYVADDGPGIPEADREAVFEGGFSTDPNGTGLGLVIVDRIAEAHGWAVGVGTSESGGARFDVSRVDIVS